MVVIGEHYLASPDHGDDIELARALGLPIYAIVQESLYDRAAALLPGVHTYVYGRNITDVFNILRRDLLSAGLIKPGDDIAVYDGELESSKRRRSGAR